jgi:hypothetical protein
MADIGRSDLATRAGHLGAARPLPSLSYPWVRQSQNNDPDRQRDEKCCQDDRDDAQGEPNATPDHAGVL